MYSKSLSNKVKLTCPRILRWYAMILAAFDEKGIVVDHSSMTGNDENDRRSSRPQMLSRLLRGDELPKA